MGLKHTPGPWKAHETGFARSGVPEFEIHWSDIGECVAEVVHGEADARLVAAAPELLAALQGALSDFLKDHYYDHPTANEWRALIDKATGAA